MKRFATALLATTMALTMVGCGKSKSQGSSIAGTYTLSGAVMGGEEWDLATLEAAGMVEGSYVILNEDGTGEIAFAGEEPDAMKYDTEKSVFVSDDGTSVSYKLEGDTITVTYFEDSESDAMTLSYTRKSDSSNTTSTSTGTSVTLPKKNGIAGTYSITGAVIGGEEWDLAMLEAFQMLEGNYIILNEDGTGEFATNGKDPEPITYDESKSEFHFQNTDMTLPYAKEGDTISVTFPSEREEDASTLKYTLGANIPSAHSTASEQTVDFDKVQVANSIPEAFEGVQTPAGSTNFVSTTTAIHIGSVWYGNLITSNATGPSCENSEKDVFALLNSAGQEKPYFEVFTGDNTTTDDLVLSMFVEVNDDYLVADIGNEDAWIYNRYLVEDEWLSFSPDLKNGALEINYAYVEPSDGSTCDVKIFLREQGAKWDEKNDPLPPNYEAYKTMIVEE